MCIYFEFLMEKKNSLRVMWEYIKFKDKFKFKVINMM